MRPTREAKSPIVLSIVRERHDERATRAQDAASDQADLERQLLGRNRSSDHDRDERGETDRDELCSGEDRRVAPDGLEDVREADLDEVEPEVRRERDD